MIYHGWAWYDGTTGTSQRMIRGWSDQVPKDLNAQHLFIGDGEGIYGFVVDLEGNQKSLSGQGFTKVVPQKINDAGWIVGDAMSGPNSGGYS